MRNSERSVRSNHSILPVVVGLRRAASWWSIPFAADPVEQQVGGLAAQVTGEDLAVEFPIGVKPLVEDLYRRIQLPPSWVSRLTDELEAEIVERQPEASERRVVLTKTLAKLVGERSKLVQAFLRERHPA